MKHKILYSSFISLVILAVTLLPVSAAPSAAGAGNWVTDFTLFNTGTTSTGNNISIMRYQQFTGGTADAGQLVTSQNIGVNGSYYYNPATDPNFPSGFSGSIVINASDPLAGTVTMANGLTYKAYASDAYSAVASPSNTVILPIIMSHAGAGGVWNTRISVQNAGSGTTNVSIKYIGTNAPANPDTINNLPQNQMGIVDQSTLTVTNFNGSAIVTSTNPLAVVVEEYKSSGGVEIAYNGIPNSSADTSILMPGYIDQRVWATDFTIVNTTTSNTTATVTFANSMASITGPLSGGGSVYLNAHVGLPAGWSGTFPSDYNGAATVTAGQKVVVAYNVANSLGTGNSQEGYVGFSTAAATANVVVPLIENLYSTGWITTFSVQVVGGGNANLSLTYGGNKAPLCNPCTKSISGSYTFNQGSDGHVPVGFLGGVKISSSANIVVIADQNNFKFAPYAQGDAAAGFVGLNQ